MSISNVYIHTFSKFHGPLLICLNAP